MSTRLVLVRHGETFANREFRYIGSRDDQLSPVGTQQASRLGLALEPFAVDAIYTSPLQRTVETARLIAQVVKVPVQTLDALVEQHYGLWEGLSRAEVLARSPQDAEFLAAWELDPTLGPPEGESLPLVQQRVRAAVDNLARKHDGQTVVLVSHVGPIKVLLCDALQAPLSSVFHIFLDPATISVIDWGTRPVLRLMNSHAHLGWENARWLEKHS